MFDIGFSELLVIAVVALIVLGPERLPKAARFAGLWMRRARQQWYSVKSEFENELAADELKRSLRETQASLRDAEAQLRGGMAALQQQVASLEQQATEPGLAPTPAPEPADSESGLESARMMDEMEPPPPADEDLAGLESDAGEPAPRADDAGTTPAPMADPHGQR